MQVSENIMKERYISGKTNCLGFFKERAEQKSKNMNTFRNSQMAPMLPLQSSLVPQHRSCIFCSPRGSGFIFITYGFLNDWCNYTEAVQADVSSRDFLWILHLMSHKKKIYLDTMCVLYFLTTICCFHRNPILSASPCLCSLLFIPTSHPWNQL